MIVLYIGWDISIPMEGESIRVEVIVRYKCDSESIGGKSDGQGKHIPCIFCKQCVAVAQIIEGETVFGTYVEIVKSDEDRFGVGHPDTPVTARIVFI